MHWTILGRPETACDCLDRRNFIKVGLLAGTGLTLVDRLRAAAHADQPKRSRSAILVYLAGGPSHFETFDPKPLAPAEIRGPFNAISTAVPGVQICETLPRLAKLADRYSLVRSVCHKNAGHGGGQRCVQTGYDSASSENELPHDYPVLGSFVAKVRGPISNGLPTFIRCPNADDGGAAYLGNAYDPMRVAANGRPVGVELKASIPIARLEDRRALRAQFDGLARRFDTPPVMEAMDDLEKNAFAMLTSPAAFEAFDINRETRAMRDRYGDHSAGQSLLMARRFVEAGAGLVSVRIGSWDHHGAAAGGTTQAGCNIECPRLDQALAALLADLSERGLSDDVLVWCWGEFGRTPRMSRDAGRDHWPQAQSVLLAGGGLQAGRVIGATNAKGEYPVERAVSPADVLATVYRQLGIDPTQQFVNSAGRPVAMLPHSEAIGEL